MTKRLRVRQIGAALFLLLMMGCRADNGEVTGRYATLKATLWTQQSAEYWAMTTQIYESATQQMMVALADPTWTAALEQGTGYELLPTAVILDVDDTVLESSVYTAQRMIDGEGFTPETWAEFVEAKQARPVPGSLEFCKYADSLGVSVFFVTNNDVTLTDAVADALRSHGYPVSEGNSNVITRTDVRDKGPRRKIVTDGHRVLLLLGDDGNDFAPDLGRGSRDGRHTAVSGYARYWGTKWFVLPNPMYGSWESAILGSDAPEGDAEKFQATLDALDVQ